MKKLLLTTTAAAMALTSLSANASVEANIGATSNYLWRGVTQTLNATAVQGGIDYGHDSGFYAGTWASNVDFGGQTSYEIDFYAGYAGQFTEDFGYDVSYIYYAYPDTEGDSDFGEATIALSWKWLSVSYAKVIHAQFDETDLHYIQATASFPLSDSLELAAHYGHSTGDLADIWYGEAYSDYSLSLTKSTKIGDVSFAVSKTDIDAANLDDAKFVLGYNYSFEL